MWIINVDIVVLGLNGLLWLKKSSTRLREIHIYIVLETFSHIRCGILQTPFHSSLYPMELQGQTDKHPSWGQRNSYIRTEDRLWYYL